MECFCQPFGNFERLRIPYIGWFAGQSCERVKAAISVQVKIVPILITFQLDNIVTKRRLITVKRCGRFRITVEIALDFPILSLFLARRN